MQEVEDYSNRYLFHPISRRLTTVLAWAGIHPNVVSFTGVFFGILAGYYFYHNEIPNAALWGFFYMLVWHVLDGADGQLARLTGKATATGRAIDGLADHLVFLAVYLGMAFLIYQQGNPHITWIVLLAGASHAMQASMLDRERQTYRFWVHSDLPGSKPVKAPRPDNPILKGLHIYFQFIAEMFDSNEAIKFQAHEMKMSARDRETSAAYYRKNYVNYVHIWTSLSPNAHTLAIFVFNFIGVPLGYFLFEIIAMNILLMALLFWKHKKDARFAAYLKTLKT